MYVKVSVINISYERSFYTEKCLNVITILSFLLRRMILFLDPLYCMWRYAVAQLVEALRFKPEGHGFHSRRCQWNFSLT